MSNKGLHNPSSHFFSNDDFEKIKGIIDIGLVVNGDIVLSFNEKQKDTLLTLLQNGKYKKEIFDLGIDLLQTLNYCNENPEIDSHTTKCIQDIQQKLEHIFSDNIVQREMSGTTSRDLSVRKYYSIEFAKGHFTFHTLEASVYNDLPGFSKSLTSNGKFGLKPDSHINNILFSGNDIGKTLEDYICKANIAYEDLQNDIDFFTRYTVNSGVLGIPSIINWREFYLSTALYQNLYSEIKVFEEGIDSMHETESQSKAQGMYGYNIGDIVDIRTESFLHSILAQIKQAYISNNEEKIRECDQTLKRLGRSKEARWKKTVMKLQVLCKMYNKLKTYIRIIQQNYGDNPYYTILSSPENSFSDQEIVPEENQSLQDELRFFRHKKFVHKRGHWNAIAKKTFTLQHIEQEFLEYLFNLQNDDA